MADCLDGGREDAYKKMYELVKQNYAQLQLPPLFSYEFYIYSSFRDKRTIDLALMSNYTRHALLEIMFFSFFEELPGAQISDYWARMAGRCSADVYRGKMLLAFSKSRRGLPALKRVTGLKEYAAPWYYRVQVFFLRVMHLPLEMLISLMPERIITKIKVQRQRKRTIR